jgi:thiol-disulfide isomerase/thioredoxin
MRIRWAIAVVGIVALAALTVTTQMPWLTRRQPAMQEIRRDPLREAETPGGPAMLACPADAKRANLDFTMKDASGQDVSLSRYKGKVIVLDFWATWCGPCKVEIPHFVEFQDKYGKDGLQIVGISVDDPLEKLAPYAREMQMNYTVLQGLGHDDVQDAFGPILGIPVTHMISRDGKICATHTGLTGKDVFEREIKALL